MRLGVYVSIVLLLSISVADASAPEIPALMLDEGANVISIAVANNYFADLKSVSVVVDSDAIPEWLSVAGPSRAINIERGAKVEDTLTMTFVVTDAPSGASAEVPLLVSDADGNEWRFKVQTSVSNAMPAETALNANFPNPFNPTTTIGYSLKSNDHAKLVVYNSLGQVVRTLVDSPQTAGIHTVQWDGRDDSGRKVSSGVYLYRMIASGYTKTIRMTLAK